MPRWVCTSGLGVDLEQTDAIAAHVLEGLVASERESLFLRENSA